jgi:hypothetical protein
MLTASNALHYQTTGTRESKKSDLMVISEMKSTKILWYLTYRHRVGLLSLCTAFLLAYIAYDKFLHVFI